MVFDNIKNAEIYYGMHKNFKAAFEFIKKAVAENLPTGRYELDGDNLYAPISEYDTNPEGNVFEGHKNYIDLQFVFEGKERIDVIEIDKATSDTEYDTEKDFQLFKTQNDAVRVLLNKGDFAIFYPNDLHAPGLSYDGNVEKVKKIVVKVKI